MEEQNRKPSRCSRSRRFLLILESPLYIDALTSFNMFSDVIFLKSDSGKSKSLILRSSWDGYPTRPTPASSCPAAGRCCRFFSGYPAVPMQAQLRHSFTWQSEQVNGPAFFPARFADRWQLMHSLFITCLPASSPCVFNLWIDPVSCGNESWQTPQFSATVWCW